MVGCLAVAGCGGDESAVADGNLDGLLMSAYPSVKGYGNDQ